jgi:nucleotide-binding universal stress UspA family protein
MQVGRCAFACATRVPERPKGAIHRGARSGACTTDTTFEGDCVLIPRDARIDAPRRRGAVVRKGGKAMRLLIPVDGSPHSEAALRFVAARSDLHESHTQIDVLNVQYPIPPRAGRAVGAEFVHAWHEAESRKILKPAVAMLKEAQLDPAWFYRVGTPGVEIAQWAETHDVDLIVMGSRGRTGRANVLLGSVAQAVLAECRTPVLLIRRDTAPRRGSLRVGLAFDGSQHSRAALDFAIAQQTFFGPRFTLNVAHVVDEVPIQVKTALANLASTKFRHEEVQALRQEAFDGVMAPARKAIASAGLAAIEEMLVSSNPGEALAAWARRAKLDLLVMGSHGMSALKLMALGSVAAGVGARCDTPLLLVRPQ